MHARARGGDIRAASASFRCVQPSTLQYRFTSLENSDEARLLRSLRSVGRSPDSASDRFFAAFFRIFHGLSERAILHCPQRGHPPQDGSRPKTEFSVTFWKIVRTKTDR